MNYQYRTKNVFKFWINYQTHLECRITFYSYTHICSLSPTIREKTAKQQQCITFGTLSTYLTSMGYCKIFRTRVEWLCMHSRIEFLYKQCQLKIQIQEWNSFNRLLRIPIRIVKWLHLSNTFSQSLHFWL